MHGVGRFVAIQAKPAWSVDQELVGGGGLEDTVFRQVTVPDEGVLVTAKSAGHVAVAVDVGLARRGGVADDGQAAAGPAAVAAGHISGSTGHGCERACRRVGTAAADNAGLCFDPVQHSPGNRSAC